MTDQEITRLAESVLAPLLGPSGLESVGVSAGRDHDGDPVLFVAAHYRLGSEVPKGDVLLRALGLLHEALQNAGEERPPYLEHRFSDDAVAYEDQIESEPDDMQGPQP